jgi:hypothetical protein
MDAGSCPNCGVMLEGAAGFCHNCGLDLTHPAPPAFKGGALAPLPANPMMAGLPPMESPPTPMSHNRAIGVIGGIILIFTASMLVFLALSFLFNNAFFYREHWDGWDYYEERVIVWEWIIATAFELVAFTVGIIGGILAIRGTRFTIALTGGVLVTIGGAISVFGDEFAIFPFILILGIISTLLIILARDGFREPVGAGRAKGEEDRSDNYGWSRQTT